MPRLSRYGAEMKHIPSPFDDPEAEAAADARAEADLREGRSISHGAMVRWLTSWGSGKRLPKPVAGD